MNYNTDPNNEENKRKYVSDFISKENIEAMEKGNNYSITCPTNAGKTHFMIKKFIPIVSQKYKILIMCNRSALKQQTWNEYIKTIRKNKNVKIASYQTTKAIDYNIYDIIVFDECHSLVLDSAYNHICKDILDKLNTYAGIKLFISATIETIKPLIEGNLNILCDFPEEEKRTIGDLLYTEHEDIIASKINTNTEDNKKSISFCSSITRAEKMSTMTTNSKTITAKNKKGSNDYKQIVENERFETMNIFTTKLLDNGVNIIDKDITIKSIIGLFDQETIKQEVGRVRDLGNNKFDLIVLEPSKGSVTKKINSIEKQLSAFTIYQNEGLTEALKLRKTHFDTFTWLFLDDEGIPQADKTKVSLLSMELKWYTKVKTFGYASCIAELFNISIERIRDLDSEELETELFNQFLDIRMFEDEQKRFKKFLEIHGLRRSDGSKNIGIRTINGFFEDNNIKFELVSSKTSKRINGIPKTHTYWKLKTK